jgi:hypothetical protein
LLAGGVVAVAGIAVQAEPVVETVTDTVTETVTRHHILRLSLADDGLTAAGTAVEQTTDVPKMAVNHDISGLAGANHALDQEAKKITDVVPDYLAARLICPAAS